MKGLNNINYRVYHISDESELEGDNKMRSKILETYEIENYEAFEGYLCAVGTGIIKLNQQAEEDA